ncbi:ubiquitin-associated protein 1-like [Conger conger]|uniref:ubiquitin-associated protein 1-like n=1 Tax=Conger conger TaxID=82655 RepID=UPI002A5A0BF4|nr:ubiquitin-associated protein 1-like [Conger conger]XP_061117144.1 ubiquitin-associated protein 1-like [Conger conger]XP_061117145.1 ubiquitin-associated protein 1-like [Conger conger]XP_061117146.1 ubiquitin-associated protein 1-like [Conger conger]XP_061117147.1 ubiquitin-associated protein 1-like [Conger conger]
MAGWKSGSDSQNSGPCSYVDQVPFKINDRFRCPAKVGLPVGFSIPDCTSLLAQFEYDFSLERRVVRWGEELEEARAAQERARQEAESAAVRQAASREQEAEPSDGTPPPRPSDNKAPPPPALNPVMAGLSHGAILTPLPAPRLGPPARPAPPAPLRVFDLADFESAEDPFDKLELKTLNDKEELRSILFMQAPTPTPTPLPPVKTGLHHRTNGLVAPPKQELEAGPPCNIRSLSFPKLSDSAPSPAPQHSLPNGTPPLTRRALPQKDVISHLAYDGVLKRSPPLPAPGPRPPGVVGQGGALLGLTPRERQCVETVVAMGYPYEGVLKAMQRQGWNMEQVLDYLILHARLCERGFDARTVEECLEMYQCSEAKALEFLQLVSRFGEMGFDRDAVKEVLRLHDNDQDRALEELMTRATTS